MKIPPLFEGDFCVSRLLKMRKKCSFIRTENCAKIVRLCEQNISKKSYIF